MNLLSRPLIYLVCFAITAGLLLAPVADAQQPTPPPPPSTGSSGGSTPPARPGQPVSTAGSILKGVGIVAGIGAAVGLLAYAGKHCIGGSTPWTGKGAALATAGGVVGALAVGTVAFFVSSFFAITDGLGVGNLDEKTFVLVATGIGALVGGIVGALLGGKWGDNWAASSSSSSTSSGACSRASAAP